MTTDKIVQLSPDMMKFSAVEQAIEDIKAGKFIVVADDEGRENEGDLVCAASLITPEMVNFMSKEARGLICVSLSAGQAEKLGLPQMVDENTDPNQTAFTVSIDAGPEFGVTTGISAADRATTIQRMTASNATPQDFRRPGHIFPVQAKNGGVLRRVGHSEAASDLTRLAGFPAMGVMCEILNDDGSMARRDDLAAFAKKHDLAFITVAQIIQYRLQSERDVVRRVVREIDTKFGRFTAIGYRDMNDGAEHLALVKGDPETLGSDTPYVRVQHENIITDVLGRASEDVPHEMAQALSFIEAQGKGAVIYLRQRDDSAHGLVGSLKAYGHATPFGAYHAGQADLRDYGVGAQILIDLGIKKFRMLGRSTKKIIALRGYGLEIVDNMPLASSDNFDFDNPGEDPAVPAFISAASHHDEIPVVTPHRLVEPKVTEPKLTEPKLTEPQIAEAQVAEPKISEPQIKQQEEAAPQPTADIIPVMSEPVATAEITPISAAQQQKPQPASAVPSASSGITTIVQAARNENNKPEDLAAQNNTAQNNTTQNNTAAPVAVPVVSSELAPVPDTEKVNGTYMPESTFSNQHPVTMRMSGQVISNQALFEG